MPLPPDGHFSTSKSSVRFLFDLPEEGACENKNSSHRPKNIGKFTQKTSFWVLQEADSSNIPLASAPMETEPVAPRSEPLATTCCQLCGFRCHVAHFLVCKTGRGRLCSTESSDRLRWDRISAPHRHPSHETEAGPARSGG